MRYFNLEAESMSTIPHVTLSPESMCETNGYSYLQASATVPSGTNLSNVQWGISLNSHGGCGACHVSPNSLTLGSNDNANGNGYNITTSASGNQISIIRRTAP
jgi:hypothetical protein